MEKDKFSVYSITPGFVPTTELFREQNVVGKFLLKVFALIEGRTIEEGADTIVWLASAEKNLWKQRRIFQSKKRRDL